MIIFNELVNNKFDLKLRQSILKVLAYFACFNYPILAEEIYQYIEEKNLDLSVLTTVLMNMEAEKNIFKFNCFYSLANSPQLAQQRVKNNEFALKLLPIGKKISLFIFCFPFISAVCISGSLSKNVADENSDIDYFIITKRNRLWLARTFVHAFKKLSYITGSQHKFCMNYFIDEDAMEIEEKNIFTAIELVTLLPICGTSTTNTFFNANKWANNFYPNIEYKNNQTPCKSSYLKNALESIFNNAFGDWLDNYLMNITGKRWKKKEIKHKLTIKGDRMSLKMGKHFAKPNPIFFQKKVLSTYYNKLNEIGIKL